MITTLRRFEIHSVEPPVGSEEGGSRVVVKGIGFGDKSITNQVGPVEIVGGDRRWLHFFRDDREGTYWYLVGKTSLNMFITVHGSLCGQIAF